MTRNQVLSILGEPEREFTPDEVAHLGQPMALGGGPVSQALPYLSVLAYSQPPLWVVLHEGGRVGALQLGYTESLRVIGYDELEFKYLSDDQVHRLGKPVAVYRDENAEKTLLSKAPAGTVLEYHVYEYPDLKLGFVIDRTKQKSSKYFFGLNYIAVTSGKR